MLRPLRVPAQLQQQHLGSIRAHRKHAAAQLPRALQVPGQHQVAGARHLGFKSQRRRLHQLRQQQRLLLLLPLLRWLAALAATAGWQQRAQLPGGPRAECQHADLGHRRSADDAPRRGLPREQQPTGAGAVTAAGSAQLPAALPAHGGGSRGCK